MGDKIPLSFKDTTEEKKLLEWINIKSAIIGRSGFIKQVLYEKMLQEEKVTKE